MSTFTTPTRVFRVGEALNHNGAAELLPVGTVLDGSDRRGAARYTKISPTEWQMPGGSTHPNGFIADGGDFHHIVSLPEERAAVTVNGRTYSVGDVLHFERWADFDALPVGTVILNRDGSWGETTKIAANVWRRASGREVGNGSLSLVSNRLVSLPEGTETVPVVPFEYDGRTWTVGSRVEGRIGVLDALPVGTVLRYVGQRERGVNGMTVMKREGGGWSNRNDHLSGNRPSSVLSARGLEIASMPATTVASSPGFQYGGSTYREGDQITNVDNGAGALEAMPVGTVIRYPNDVDWNGETCMKRPNGHWSNRNNHDTGIRSTRNLQSSAPFTIVTLPGTTSVAEATTEAESSVEAGTFAHLGATYRPGATVSDSAAFRAFPVGTVLHWSGTGTGYDFSKREDGAWRRLDNDEQIGGRDGSGLSLSYNTVVSFPVVTPPVTHLNWTMDGSRVVREGDVLNDLLDRNAFLLGLPLGSVVEYSISRRRAQGYRLTKIETNPDRYDWVASQIDESNPHPSMRAHYRTSSLASSDNVFVSVPAASVIGKNVNSREFLDALPVGTVFGTHGQERNRWEKRAQDQFVQVGERTGTGPLPRINVSSAHFVESLPQVSPEVAPAAAASSFSPVHTLTALEAVPVGTHVRIDPGPERDWVRSEGGLAVRAVAGVSLPLAMFESRCLAGHVSAATGVVTEVAAAPSPEPVTPSEPTPEVWVPEAGEWVWVVNDGSAHGMRHYYDVPVLGLVTTAVNRGIQGEVNVASGRATMSMRASSANNGGMIGQTVPLGAVERAGIVPSRTQDSWWRTGERDQGRIVLYVDSTTVVTFREDGTFVSVGRDESGSDAAWLAEHSLMRSAPEWGDRVMSMARAFSSHVRPVETPAPVETAVPAGYRLVPAETIEVMVDLIGSTEYEIGLAEAERHVESGRTFDVEPSDTDVTLNWTGRVTFTVEGVPDQCACDEVTQAMVEARLVEMGTTFSSVEIDSKECEHC